MFVLVMTLGLGSSGCWLLLTAAIVGGSHAATEKARKDARIQAFASGPFLAPETRHTGKNEWRYEGMSRGALCFTADTDGAPSAFDEAGQLTFWSKPDEDEAHLQPYRVVYEVLASTSETHYRQETKKSQVRDASGQLAGTVENEVTVPYEVYDTKVRACADGVDLAANSGKLAVLTTIAGEQMWRVPGEQPKPAAPQARR
jgi:hypothetical protein